MRDDGASPSDDPNPAAADESADGLTAEELRRGRESWWDAGFTRALVEAIPDGCRELVEVGCGLGHVARKVLPQAPGLSYLGVDVDRARLAETREDLEGGPLAERTRFVAGSGEALPLGDETTDVVLFCMTLQHVASPADALRESRRVLRPGGALVAAEPDNLGQRWFFDGPLEEVTRSFAAVIEQCREARAPADLAIGPQVPGLARAAGFGDVEMRVHAIFVTRYETARECRAKWEEMLRLFAHASDLPDNAPAVGACREALDRWLNAGDPERVGHCGTTVPVFVTIAG